MGSKIRKDLKSLFASLDPSQLLTEQRELERVALARLHTAEASGALKSFRTVSLYAAQPGEVDVRFLESFFHKKNVKTVYPRVAEDGGLEFYATKFSDLKSGAFGILEPSSSMERVEIGQIDFAIFPGRAFGKKGERLGSGKGYYDRAFGSYRDIPRAAFSFNYQLLETLPQFEWDLSMDWLLAVGHEYRSGRILP